MKWLKKYRVPIAALMLSVLTGITAVWTRSAIAGRQAEKAIPKISASAHAEEEGKKEYILPTSGNVLRGDSADMPVWSGTLQAYEGHEGVDFACGETGLVYAVADGRVTETSMDGRYGAHVTISHEDGAKSLYASLSEIRVRTGERVKGGQVIGLCGMSAISESDMGAHLHFVFYENNEIALSPFTMCSD